MRKLLILSLLSSYSLFGQVYVTGKVIDDQQKPLSYATIAFQSMNISDHLEGTFSAANGQFELSIPVGEYQVTFQMVGYENVMLENVTIESESDLGTIVMKEDAIQLEEIVVRTERSYIESDLGKRTLFIGSDLANSGSTAINALESLPSVSTTIEGNVNVRGSNNVIIYVNGRETKRDPKSLQFISADALQKIELITNPSAKYDAEGVAGIINLVYAKTKSTKLDGFMSLSAPFRGTVGLSGSISSDNLTFFLNASERRSIFETSDNQTRETPNDDLIRYDNLTSSFGEGATREITTGITFESDTNFSIGLEMNYLRWDDTADQDQQGLFYYQNGDNNSIFLENNWLEIEDELTFTLSSEKKLRKSHSLKLQLTTGGEDEVNKTKYNIDEVDLSDTPIRQSIRQSDETEDQRYYQAKFDYSVPINSKLNLEAGFVSDFYRLNVYQDISFLDADDVANLFGIQMNKYAGYALLEDKRNRLEYAIGIRYENFESTSINKSTDSTFTQQFKNIFPSVQWKYTFEKVDHSVGFNFTRRINRPSFWEVSPFFSYRDPLNLETGNPFLKPEFAYLYELTYSIQKGKLSTDFTVFRRSTENVIQPVTQSLNESQVLVTYQNFGIKNDDGLEWNASYDISKKVSIEGTGSAYRTVFNEQDNEVFFQGRWNTQLRLRARLRFDSGWGINLTQYYRGPRYGIQSMSISQYYFNASVQKQFHEKRGTATLSFRDILNTRVFGTDLVGENLTLNNEYKFQTQMLTLSLRYKIIQN